MTTMQIDRAVVEQALDFIVATNKSFQFWLVPESNLNKTVTALRAALAQQDEPVQEPVAWYQKRGQEVLTSHPACWGREDEPWTPLYTAPPQRKPLTEEEIKDCFHAARNAKLGASQDNSRHRLSVVEIARAIERAHGIGETK